MTDEVPEQKEYEALFLVKKTITARSDKEAEQAVRSIANANFRNNAAMKHFELDGFMAERKE